MLAIIIGFVLILGLVWVLVIFQGRKTLHIIITKAPYVNHI